MGILVCCEGSNCRVYGIFWNSNMWQTAFPDFFVGLVRNPNKDKYDDTDFYSAHDSSQRMADISSWIKDP
jgi:hypothetical protein